MIDSLLYVLASTIESNLMLLIELCENPFSFAERVDFGVALGCEILWECDQYRKAKYKNGDFRLHFFSGLNWQRMDM